MYVIGGLLKEVAIYKHLFNLEKKKSERCDKLQKIVEKMSLWEQGNDDNPIKSQRYVCCVEEERKEFISMVLFVPKRDTKNQRDPDATRQYTSSNVKKLAASVRGTVGHLSCGV